MTLSLFSDYSLRLLMYAALRREVTFQLDDVAAAYHISRNHLAKVVHKLAQQGLLETRRGRGGGIRLAVAPEQIRIGQFLRESENQPRIVECFDITRSQCRISGACKLKAALAQAMNAFFEVLDQYTLADLVDGPHQQRMFSILFETRPKTAP